MGGQSSISPLELLLMEEASSCAQARLIVADRYFVGEQRQTRFELLSK